MSGTIVIARDLGELWMALVEDGRVVELEIDAEGAPSWLGAIAKARVIKAGERYRGAFVDIGLGREAFLVPDRAWPPPEDLAPGAELIVQVTREPARGKGLRVTRALDITGQLVVLMPGTAARGVSHRIEDESERERLRELLVRIAPADVGLVARTVSAGASEEAIVAEVEALVARWRAIEQRAALVAAPVILEGADDAPRAFVRDRLRGVPERIVLDLGAREEAVTGDGAWPIAVEHHAGPLPAIEAYGLDRALAEGLAAEVPLLSGGRLVIHETEALVAIDVNSGGRGSGTNGGSIEDSFLETNLAAAREIARQIRLRDLAGLIVVDFIDMRRRANREDVDHAFAAALAADGARIRRLPLSEFCVAELTRQRRRRSLAGAHGTLCPTCSQGVVASAPAAARRLLRTLRQLARPIPEGRFRVSAEGEVLADARAIADRWGAESHLPAMSRISFESGAERVEVVGR